MKQPRFSPYRSVAALTMLVLLALPLIAFAQKRNYSWMELPKKDAERTLANSPWSQIQVDTDVTEQFFSPTRPGTSAVGQTHRSGHSAPAGRDSTASARGTGSLVSPSE